MLTKASIWSVLRERSEEDNPDGSLETLGEKQRELSKAVAALAGQTEQLLDEITEVKNMITKLENTGANIRKTRNWNSKIVEKFENKFVN